MDSKFSAPWPYPVIHPDKIAGLSPEARAKLLVTLQNHSWQVLNEKELVKVKYLEDGLQKLSQLAGVLYDESVRLHNLSRDVEKWRTGYKMAIDTVFTRAIERRRMGGQS